jgi:hypothetical protein
MTTQIRLYLGKLEHESGARWKYLMKETRGQKSHETVSLTLFSAAYSLLSFPNTIS